MQFTLEEMPVDTSPYKILPWDHIKNLKSTTILIKEGAQEAYKKIGWRMVATCLADDGIGLAAPQIGLFKKAVLIREFANTTKDDVGDDVYEAQPSFRLYLNPTWKGCDDSGKSVLNELCLSVVGKGFPIERFQNIEATWYEFEDGVLVYKEGTLSDFPARVLQHEVDHLQGI